MKKKKIDISIVVPVYNEQNSIIKLHQRLTSTMNKVGKEYELIFIDDGSTDKSLQILKSLKDAKIIIFRKNFGQTAALAAGFHHARGEVIVTIDSDLQNDPKDIPKLLHEIEKGYDVVSGWRNKRQDNFFFRTLPSIIANSFISLISGVKLHDFGCTLKAYRKEITKNINLYGEMHRFIPAIAANIGANIKEVKVRHKARKYGKTKYGLDKTIRVILDLMSVKFLLSYQTRPLHLFGGIGILLSSIGGTIFSILVYEKIFLHQSLSTRPLFLISIFFILVGIQFITIGLLTELTVRVYYESQNKTPYYIKEIIS